MTTTSLMANILHRDLAARGIKISLGECEAIMARVLQASAAVAERWLVDQAKCEERPN